MKIRRKTMIVAAAIAVGGALAVTTPAAAATTSTTPSTFGALVPSTFVEVYGSADIPESGVQSATAPCPVGTAAVSAGGFSATTDGLLSITPGPSSTSGVATARAGRGEIGRQVIAQVTCAPSAQFAGTSVAAREQTLHSSTGEWTQTVTCPAGMRAFGGGGYFRARNGAISTDPFFMSANVPTNDGRSWRVSALDRTFTDTLVVTTRCAVQSTSTRLVEENFPMPSIPGSTIGRANGYAHCPAGFLPISGGAQITQDGSESASQPRLLVSVSVRNGQIGWFASGISQGEHPRLHVVALCGS